MTKEEILKTSWAKEFQKDDLSSFQYALDFCLQDDKFVEIYESNEMDTSKWEWVICISGTNFWLDTKKTKKECIALCKAMGWNYN